MKTSFRFPQLSLLSGKPFYPFYEGEEGGDDDAAAAEAAAKAAEEAAGKEGEDKKFTQKDVDNFINKRFSKEKKEKETLVTQLKSLETTANLSKEEKEDLVTRIDDLETSMLTETEKAAKEKKDAETKHARELKKSVEEKDIWHKRYTDSTIDRALTDAAVSAGAESSSQIRLMLRGSAYLSEDKDDAGKTTGNFTPKVKFIGLDEDGKIEKELDLPITEALTKIKEDGLNKNLFKHGSTGGTGAPPTGGGGKGSDEDAEPDPADYQGNPTGFTEAYHKWRETYNVDGSRKPQIQQA